MNHENPFRRFPGSEILDTFLPDLVLSFAFFTSLVYAVLGKRFDHQRSAVGMSAAIGLALSVGLVWWENRMGLSIRNLGPTAIGFAVVVLTIVMYKAIGRIGGNWAGEGIAVGVSILIATILGFDLAIDPEIVYSLMVVALVVGLFGFLLHQHSRASYPAFPSAPVRTEFTEMRHDMDDLHQDRRIGDELRRGIKRLMERSRNLGGRTEDASDVMVQIRRLLPAEGWLTEQLARLRRKAYYMREGHVARIKQLHRVLKKLPVKKKQLASWELSKRYQELHLDQRLERLDGAVAEFERRIKELTIRARQAIAKYEFQKVEDLLKEAQKLQTHNSKLLKQIESTEEKITHITEQIANRITEVDE